MATTPKNIYRGSVGIGGTLGQTWFVRASFLGGSSGIVFANGMFVTSNSSSNTTAANSTDGITWSPSASGDAQSSAIAYGAGVFVRTFGSNQLAYANSSTDGVTWTRRTLPTTGYWNSVAYGSGTFLITADYTTTVSATSPDGITWTQRVMPVAGSFRLAYGSGVFLAILPGAATATAYTSPDGINWTARTLPAAGATSISFANGLFFAFNGSALYTSPDGITWTTRTMPSASGWGTVAYGGGLYVAGNSSSNFVATSPDTITWTRRSVPSPYTPQYLAFGNNVFVAAGGQGVVSSHPGNAPLYTTGPSSTAVVTDIVVTNPTSTAALVTLQIDGVDLLSQQSVAANDRTAITTRQVIDANKAITAFTNGTAVNMHVNGVEII